MINLKCRTEYSFRTAYGRIEQILERGGVGICDRNGTWGHVQFAKAAKRKGIKPVFGVELACVEDATLREKQPANWMSFLAKNNKGLKELYELVTLATSQIYYIPRIDYSNLHGLSEDLFVFSGALPKFGLLPRKNNFYVELSPVSSPQLLKFAQEKGYKVVACSDNYYPSPEMREVYEVIASDNRDSRTTAMHLLQEWEWREALPWAPEEALKNAAEIYNSCDAELPTAKMMKFESSKSLKELCLEGATLRRTDLSNEVYKSRLERELELIKQKDFEDYFYVIADMVSYAKRHMLVGPARGSSCGSLVCYLLGITDIDPIPYDLLFERFIDINREDLPDIDIDFQDDRREIVFDYLREKYGTDKVARLGTVMRYKAKSAIDDVARELSIPAWEVKDLKGAIIERSSGDSRAQFCIADTFETLEIGRTTLEKHPQLYLASYMEGHARQSGQHAAGVLVTAEPIANYCSVDKKTGCVMVDKKDAEDLNLLKIDALGLTTLSVIQDVLDAVGWPREKLLSHPLDDEKAFEVLNSGKFCSIFQFDGFALQSVCRQMPVKRFEDIAAITALARPGPLNSGGTAEYIKRHNGIKETVYVHEEVRKYTEETHGIVVYQEQVMQLVRNLGKLTWEDTSTLRKAMSKSFGKEYFDNFKERFVKGATENGLPEESAGKIWDELCTFGSWGFNKSHAIAYGLVSYWCCVLKAYFPLEFAAANLRHSKKEEQVVKLIREIAAEGYKYKVFDPELSKKNWSVSGDTLIGGLLNIVGIGDKMADDIIKRKELGIELTNRQKMLLEFGKTPYDNIFEARERFGHLYKTLVNAKTKEKPVQIAEISDSQDYNYLFIGKLASKNIRDLNEVINVQKRGGKIFEDHTKELLVTFSDDSGQIRAKVGRFNYDRIGKPMVENSKIGDWFAVRGSIRKGFLSINIETIKKL